LKRIDGGAFVATDESGPPTYNAPGQIVGSSLEGSNTDIADEFTELIVTQQAYSANIGGDQRHAGLRRMQAGQ
jgi:flagellar hook protein FlgE